MEFLKNHYEKLILIVVLIAVAVAVALLPAKVPAGLMGTDSGEVISRNKLPPLSLGTNELAIRKLETLSSVVLTSNHNLLNPVTWRRMQENGPLFKYVMANEVGAGAVVISKLSPLYTIISFEGALPPNKYQLGIIQQAHKDSKQRSKKMVYLALHEKGDYFKLTGVEANAEGAVQKLTLEMLDGKVVNISKDTPYQIVAGYVADLSYPPERNIWTQKRVGESIQFDQGTNNIVDISSNEVVLSSSSGKRTKLKYKAMP